MIAGEVARRTEPTTNLIAVELLDVFAVRAQHRHGGIDLGHRVGAGRHGVLADRFDDRRVSIAAVDEHERVVPESALNVENRRHLVGPAGMAIGDAMGDRRVDEASAPSGRPRADRGAVDNRDVMALAGGLQRRPQPGQPGTDDEEIDRRRLHWRTSRLVTEAVEPQRDGARRGDHLLGAHLR